MQLVTNQNIPGTYIEFTDEMPGRNTLNLHRSAVSGMPPF